MFIGSRFVMAAVVAATTLHCGGLPGGKSLPGTDTLPNGGKVPGGMSGLSGDIDPDTCGNYAATDAGARLRAFLQATKDLKTATIETAKVVKQSCIMMGNELGMSPADLAGDDTNGICAKVITTYQNNLKVYFKPKQALKIKLTMPACSVDLSISAGAAAGCGGEATGNLQCKAAAVVKAAINAKCTEPSLTLDFDPKAAVDASKLEMTVKAMRDGIPQLLSINARMKPINDAVTVWQQSLAAIKDMGATFVQSFKDQAVCISNQLNLAGNASISIKADVKVSADVSGSASSSVGG
jgi:hypothetical protein